jgi:FkbM family methyltransferase
MHNSIKIKDGSMEDEYPEQLMATKYIKPHNKVLEIGGNIGRNSIIISSILDDDSNLVVLECDPNIANSLRRNLASNGFAPHVESAALSKRQLIQRGWDTIPSDVVLDGWKKVNTINYNELVKKYDVNFDTIVADCEGALYYILKDQPHILYNIKMLIMENDYKDASHKEFVDKLLTGVGFKRIYVRPGGWREYPKSSFEYDHIFYDNFFEVWSRDN